MLVEKLRNNKGTILALVTAMALAIGWGTREVGFAKASAERVKSQTLTAAEIHSHEAAYEGKPTGRIALYFQGQTAGTRNFATGRFFLDPGTEPHPIHQHVEEEILIVTGGKGEISCDGKTTPVEAGSIMYTAPHVKHGIRNNGKEPLEFYFVKWIGTQE